MSPALLLAPLWLGLAAPLPPPPPPEPADDAVDDAVDPDAFEEEEDAEYDDSELSDDDEPPGPTTVTTVTSTTSTSSGASAEPRIPTEGAAKPPPSQGALDRDNPLAQPDRSRRDRAGRPGSPQRVALEFKMGPFLPDVDRTYTGAGLGPYATVFGQTDDTGAATGQPKPFPMPLVAIDWQFFYLAGPLGIGAQIGLFRDKAQALVTAPLDPSALRSSADETTFTMVPLSLLVSYRFELLADRFRVPLVPYAKAGLAYSLFWSKSGSGNLSRNSDGEAAIGGIPGWQVNLGGMFRLDILEPGTAKKLDNLTGINHTYVFGEYQLSRVDNFGVGNTMSLGDSTWFAGLAIEF